MFAECPRVFVAGGWIAVATASTDGALRGRFTTSQTMRTAAAAKTVTDQLLTIGRRGILVAARTLFCQSARGRLSASRSARALSTRLMVGLSVIVSLSSRPLSSPLDAPSECLQGAGDASLDGARLA